MVNNGRNYSRPYSNGTSQRNSSNNGISCSNSKNLMKRLQMVDFAITETVLYLDAYPDSKSALNHYHQLLAERNKLAESLEASGTPITHFNNADTENWRWTNGPWPWQCEAN
ncbi:MAG: spore coat protein CotJB [Clostridia bacterium]|nr:spore coat protein CotJB [Clostridia bacterium]